MCKYIRSHFVALLLLAFSLTAFIPCFAAQIHEADSLSPAPGVSLRTNLLWDGLAEPNLGLEVALGQHVSLGVNGGLKPWPRWLAWDNDNLTNPTHWRNFAVVPELRFYPRRVYDGWFFGADAVYSHFNMGTLPIPWGLYPLLRNNRLQGDFYGGGLFAGYSWWLGSRWRLEVEAGAAVGYYNAGQYPCSHCAGIEGTATGVTVLPKLGLNLAWNLRRRQQRQELLEVISVPWTQSDKDENNNK